jgi:hypothetical protein
MVFGHGGPPGPGPGPNEAILSHPKLALARIDLIELIELIWPPFCPLEAFQANWKA